MLSFERYTFQVFKTWKVLAKNIEMKFGDPFDTTQIRKDEYSPTHRHLF